MTEVIYSNGNRQQQTSAHLWPLDQYADIYTYTWFYSNVSSLQQRHLCLYLIVHNVDTNKKRGEEREEIWHATKVSSSEVLVGWSDCFGHLCTFPTSCSFLTQTIRPSYPLRAVIGQLCRGEEGARVLPALSISLFSFLIRVKPFWTLLISDIFG